MDIGIVAARYAKALLRFATENKEEDVVYQEMNGYLTAFLKVSALQPALLSPVLKEQQKRDLLLSACSIAEEVSSSTRRFVELVLEKRRADLMHFIAQSYISQYRNSKNIVKGRLVVPMEVSASVGNRLQQILEQRTHCNVEFEVTVDPHIEGGFILEYDTYRLDASLRTQIGQLHRSLKSL